MAHGDYHCCAICDCKMDYAGFNARTKASICTTCLKQLRSIDEDILDVNEFIEWVEQGEKEDIKQKLKKLNFSTCFYGNRVDDSVREKGIEL